MTLTHDQEQAKKAILAFLLDPTEQCFVLQGYAGVGKTWLIQHVQESYKAVNKLMSCTGAGEKKKWHYTATTHKAAVQLQAATGVTVSTIHALFGLRMQADWTTGTRKLSSPKESLIKNAIIVVDEASYLDYSLLAIVETFYTSCKFIFMGDATQLTPVGLNHAPVFKRNYQTYALTQVVRQHEAHPLLSVFTQFRDYISGNTTQFPRITPCAEIIRMERPHALVAITDEFAHTDWESSKSRILAWRNKTVITYNNMLFEKANNRQRYAVGDTLINNHALPKIRTDEEIQILSIQQVTSCGVAGHEYCVLAVGGSTKVFVPDKQTDYARRKAKAIREKDYATVGTIMDTWADLRPPFAITVNKAQGSTYNKVFIDLDDMKHVKDHNQLARLLYVAMSRAKQKVIFIGDL